MSVLVEVECWLENSSVLMVSELSAMVREQAVSGDA